MPKGSLFLSGSRSRISSNCFSSSNNQKHLIQKAQIGCTPRLPHRNQETNKPETSWQSLHPSPPQKKTLNQPLKNWSLNPTNLLPTVASVCFLLRFSNSKRIFSMPGKKPVSFIQIPMAVSSSRHVFFSEIPTFSSSSFTWIFLSENSLRWLFRNHPPQLKKGA